MNKKLFPLFAILAAVFLAASAEAGNYFLADFNNGGAPNLKGGAYSVWAGVDLFPPHVTNPALGNSGYAVRYGYQSITNYDFWMNMTNGGGPRDMTGYDYLSFWVKGSNGGEFFEIQMQNNHLPTNQFDLVQIQSYVPGGKLSTNWQKVVIPLKTFSGGGFDRSIIKTLHFLGGRLSWTNCSGTIYLDDINFGTGLGTQYVDNMEFDERKSYGWQDLTAYSQPISTGVDLNNGGVSLESNTLGGSHQAFLGYGSIMLFQARTNAADEAFCNWELDNPDGVDLSACDKLVFAVKGAKNTDISHTPHVYIDDPSYSSYLPMQALTTSWQEQTYNLVAFPAFNKTKIRRVRTHSQWTASPWTNKLWIDEIRFVDSTPPVTPLVTYNYNGQLIAPNTIFTMGHNLTVSADSKTSDPGIESVRFELSTNAGASWVVIGQDYGTAPAKTVYTVPWNTSSINAGKLFSIRAVSMDSSGNLQTGPAYNNCQVVIPPAFIDLTHTVPIMNNLYLVGGVYTTNNITGVTCRQTVGIYNFLLFDVDNGFVYQHTYDNYHYTVSFRYHDDVGRLYFQYDSMSNQFPTNAPTYREKNIYMQNTGKWTNAVFELPDAYFGNRIYGYNADIVLGCDHPAAISYIQVEKKPNTLSVSCSPDAGVGTLNKVTVNIVGVNPASIVPVTLTASGSAIISPSPTQNLANGTAVFYVGDQKPEIVSLTVTSGAYTPVIQAMNFVYLYGLNDSKYVDIGLGTPPAPNGLSLTSVDATNTSIGGNFCTRSVHNTHGFTGLYFDIDNNFIYQRSKMDGYIYRFRTDYYDTLYSPVDATNNVTQQVIHCVYDGIGNSTAEPGQGINLTSDNTWKSFIFTFSDGYFGGLGGGDVSLKARYPIYVKYARLSRINFTVLDPSSSGPVNADGITLNLTQGSVHDSYYLIAGKLTSVAGIGNKSSSIANWTFINGVDLMVINSSQNLLPGFGFDKTASLVLKYDPSKLGGTKPNTLAIFTFNEKTSSWEKAGGTVNTSASNVSLNIFKSGKYAVFAAIQNDTIKAKWSSNPFSPNGDGKLDFTVLNVVLPGLTVNLHVFIYDRKGMFVRELAMTTGTEGDNFVWDGKDYNNRIVPVGPYIYQVRCDDKTYSGVVVVAK